MSRTIGYVLLALPLYACSAAEYRAEADEEVYEIIETAAQHVTGEAKVVSIDRPESTLRSRLEEDPSLEVELDLPGSLDVAAENSRDFQSRKERLYLVSLSLTAVRDDYLFNFTGSNDDTVSGVGDDSGSLSIRNDLFASRNTEAGGRVVASFVNTFLKDIVQGGSFNGASVLGLTFTQPLMRGFGKRIAREPLTQAERNVIYEMRSYERYRATFSVQIVSEYLRLLQSIQDLENVEANLESTRKDRERVESLVEASELTPVDLDRARQSEFIAEDRLNNAKADLEASFDSFKLTLGLPTEASITLDPTELERLQAVTVTPIELAETTAVGLALLRRYDYRTVVDDVEDAARGVIVAEDALRSALDFSSAVSVPTDPGNPLKFDWSQVGWSAGFNLDFALDRLPERNAYRSSLISLDVAMRNREQLEDGIKSDVRDAIRTINRSYTSYQIQDEATRQAVVRRDRAELFLEAGRGNYLDLVDAQDDLLTNQIALTGATVNYALARLRLVRDLEGLILEPQGLRYDPALPLPEGPLSEGALPGSPPSGEANTPASSEDQEGQGEKR